MFQWRTMRSKDEIDYGKRMAKLLNIPFINELNLEEMKLSNPTVYLGEDDELKLDLNTNLDKAIELLKNNKNKSFFQFNSLMYCRLYPRWERDQDEIVVMDLYWDDIRNNTAQSKQYKEYLCTSTGYSSY